MRLLYVENHARFAETVLSAFLADHTVTVVPSLTLARNAMQTGTFDAVLVDYDLNDGKGDELVREVKQNNAGLFVVAVSSHPAGNDALRNAGADAVCAKRDFARIDDVLAGVKPCYEP